MFLVHSCFQTEISVRWFYVVLGTLFTLKTNLKVSCSFLYRWRNRSSKEARFFRRKATVWQWFSQPFLQPLPRPSLEKFLIKNCSSENQRMTALKERKFGFISKPSSNSWAIIFTIFKNSVPQAIFT